MRARETHTQPLLHCRPLSMEKYKSSKGHDTIWFEHTYLSVKSFHSPHSINLYNTICLALSKGCHLDVVRGPSTPHDPESDAGGSSSSWQGHPSRKVKDEGRS
jgi:hypothetical protein